MCQCAGFGLSRVTHLGFLDCHYRHVLHSSYSAHIGAAPLLPSVEVFEVESGYDDQDERGTPTAEVDVEPRFVYWRLVREIYLGRQQIPMEPLPDQNTSPTNQDLQTCGPAILPAHWNTNMMLPTVRCLVVPAAF